MKYATPDGTGKLAKNQSGAPLFRTLGRTGLLTSVVGFGGYRVDDENPSHRAALDRALASGCNLIDTSTNYTDGGSERLIGVTLKEAFALGPLSRDQVIVVSKVGYVQGGNLEIVQQRDAENRPFPEMVRYMDGCWHCVHPDFLEDQLTRSLEKLQLECLDVYLLHNPEYFFSDAMKRHDSRPLEQVRDEFYQRIESAFAYLEKEVKRGRIRQYGVSSNTFGANQANPEMTEIARMWKVAELVGGRDHHFSVIQLPANLFESGPVLEKNNGNQTALEFAREKQIGVLVNRPLNAIVKNQIVRLADFQKKPVEGPLSEHLKKVGALEEEFGGALAISIQTPEGALPARDFFRWSRELAILEQQPLGVEQWAQLEAQILYQTRYLVQQLSSYFSPDPSLWNDWRDRYLPKLEKLLASFHNECAQASQKTSSALSRRLDSFLPAALKGESLSRKALAILIHTEGTSCILNGMRTTEYVTDSMGAAGLPPFAVSPELYLAFKNH